MHTVQAEVQHNLVQHNLFSKFPIVRIFYIHQKLVDAVLQDVGEISREPS